MDLTSTILRTGAGLVGAVFLLAASLKAVEATELMIHTGKLFAPPPRIFRFVRWLIPPFVALEGMLGAALIVGLWPGWLIPAAFFVILVFAAVSSWGVASGRVEDCGCYGGPIVVSPAASVALDGVYALVLGAAWYAGIDAPAAPWKVGAVAGVALALAFLSGYSLRRGQQSRGPLVDWSPFRAGRPWRSRWLGHPSRYGLERGEHLVALLALDCPTCRSWLKPLAFVHSRPELPDVLAAYAANEEEVDELRTEVSLPFPVVPFGRWPMRRLTRHLPRGVLVEDGVVREVWLGAMSESFVGRIRESAARQRTG